MLYTYNTCMYAYVCIHIYTYNTYTYTHIIHTHIHICIYIYIHTCIIWGARRPPAADGEPTGSIRRVY